MNADLRNALHDLAEGQEFRPGPDAWDRGRRARRRSRIVAGAAALGVVAVVAGVGALVTGTPAGLAPADQDVVPGGAIPSRIEQVSDGLESETDLAIGRGSAAFVSAAGDPVVIGATDGKPHVLDLLDWARETPTLALSPDGLQLAWQPRISGDPVPKVALLDLVTGDVTQVQLGGGGEVVLRTLSWSPNSEHVAVLGHSITELGAGQDWFGRVDVSTATGALHAPLGVRVRQSGVSVSNDGALAVGTEAGRVVLEQAGSRRRLPRAEGFPGPFSPDGSQMAMQSSPGKASHTFDVVRQRVLEHPFPADTIPTAVSRPLGWLDNRLQLLLVTPTDGADAELVVTTPQVDEQSTWRRRVGSVDPDVADTLSLAVDLVPDLDGSSSQQLTHDFGEPEGTGERDISWMIGLGVAAAIAVLMGARRLWRWSRDRGL
ncbi:hypothetical protein EXE58_06550 [Nocardioides seonyuensis]|uniref:WD40 repeat domain-containing protein n=1 Tax=Nocardioides seonyuensis TaxID=2518371 RepID=A0A4P7IDC5_9ACTN|nr:hypothetical protein [Nocardioides seonyuensis]QBX55149.1 hypothetical protein EXE58_06550 [Nocardioides seonyuensis]